MQKTMIRTDGLELAEKKLKEVKEFNSQAQEWYDLTISAHTVLHTDSYIQPPLALTRTQLPCRMLKH